MQSRVSFAPSQITISSLFLVFFFHNTIISITLAYGVRKHTARLRQTTLELHAEYHYQKT